MVWASEMKPGPITSRQRPTGVQHAERTGCGTERRHRSRPWSTTASMGVSANPGTSGCTVAALDTVPECEVDAFRGRHRRRRRIRPHLGDPVVLLHLGTGLATPGHLQRTAVPMVVVIGDHATYHVEIRRTIESDIDSVAGTVSGSCAAALDPDHVADDAAAAIAFVRGETTNRHANPAGRRVGRTGPDRLDWRHHRMVRRSPSRKTSRNR